MSLAFSQNELKLQNALKLVLIDGSIFFLATICAVYVVHMEPNRRGFFCDDKSLMLPYHNSTVGNDWLVVLHITPLVIIALAEFIHGQLNLNDQYRFELFRYKVPVSLQNFYQFAGFCVFGDMLSVLITGMSKIIIGRYRPNFLQLCQPVFLDGTNCTSLESIHKYIEDFSCGNSNASYEMLYQNGRSFPSGHASEAFYTMSFTALYLHRRMTWKSSSLAKYFLQSVSLLLATGIALSRISDNKHHWSDVFVGSVLGVTMSIITAKAAGLSKTVNTEDIIIKTQRQPMEMIEVRL